MTQLVAFAGRSRSGKGTCARVFAEEAAQLGKTSLERQFSDNGKWALARIFRPTISRVDAVSWWEELKRDSVRILLECYGSGHVEQVPLQKFLQHGLQQGGRDIFGADLWTDRIIPDRVVAPNGVMENYSMSWQAQWSAWLDGFFDEEAGVEPTDLAIISDLRQPNEAERVRDLGGLVIECYRPENNDAYVTGSDHITERVLPRELVDAIIANDSTIEDLEAKARLLFDLGIKSGL